MNNKHQELIDKKVVEFTKLFEGKNIFGSWMIINIFKMHIKDTIDTVLEKERWRIKKEIVQQTLLNEGNDTFVNLGEALWVCDSKEEREVFLKALDKTPPNKV